MKKHLTLALIIFEKITKNYLILSYFETFYITINFFLYIFLDQLRVGFKLGLNPNVHTFFLNKKYTI
jgi:hypothetical protein